MMETTSPLGRFADLVSAIVTVAVVLTFLAIHGLLVIAPIVGLPSDARPDTAQIDTVAVAVIGYVLGGVIGAKPRQSTGPTGTV